jgi:hypothetical protein
MFFKTTSTGIDSNESIPVAYVAWRAGTITHSKLLPIAPIDCLKIPAQLAISRLSCWGGGGGATKSSGGGIDSKGVWVQLGRKYHHD